MIRTPSRLTSISRRGLLGSGAAASVLAASGLSAAAAPQEGGTLRIAAPGPELYDRLLAPGTAFECLTEVDDDGTLRGELASAWAPRQGAAVWVITLRPGAVFHDGTPVRPEDVVRSLRAHAADGAGALGSVVRIWRSGEAQVGFRLVAPDPQFPFRLADPSLVVSAAEPKAPGGSGLYTVLDQGPGRRVKLRRLDRAARPQRAGWFDRVELLEAGDANGRLSMLLSGRVDLAFDLAPSAHGVLARERRLAATKVRIEVSGGGRDSLAGHVLRLQGLNGRNALRIAERGFFA